MGYWFHEKGIFLIDLEGPAYREFARRVKYYTGFPIKTSSMNPRASAFNCIYAGLNVVQLRRKPVLTG